MKVKSLEQTVHAAVTSFMNATGLRSDPVPTRLFLWPEKRRNYRTAKIESADGIAYGFAASGVHTNWHGKCLDWYLFGKIGSIEFSLRRASDSEAESSVTISGKTGVMYGWPDSSSRHFQIKLQASERPEPILVWSKHSYVGRKSLLFCPHANEQYLLPIHLECGRNRLFPKEYAWGGCGWELVSLLFVKMIPFSFLYSGFN